MQAGPADSTLCCCEMRCTGSSLLLSKIAIDGRQMVDIALGAEGDIPVLVSCTLVGVTVTVMSMRMRRLYRSTGSIGLYFQDQ